MVHFDLLAANLNDPDGELKDKYKKSKIIKDHPSGIKIGIIGYVTTDTPHISNPGKKLKFVDEIKSIQDEARKLLEEHGEMILIALGHSGYATDIKIAQSVPELDLVVGGHSHTFLWPENKKLPEGAIETIRGEYPTYIKSSNDKIIPVVQAYCYSKYLGHLTLNFNKTTGDLLEPVDGNGVSYALPEIIHHSIHPDPLVEEKLQSYRQKSDLQKYYVDIAENLVMLRKGGMEEWNIGNLITDTMVSVWNDTTIAFMNNGGIRGQIAKGSVQGVDIYSVLPFGNTVDRVTLPGLKIKKILENNIAHVCMDKSCYGTFYQVSGLRVVFRILEDNVGHRIESIKTKCDDDKDKYCDLLDDKNYNVAVPSFLANGRNFNSFPREKGMVVDYDAFVKYITKNNRINTRIEGRIIIKYGEDPNNGSFNIVNKNSLFFVLIIALLNALIMK